MYINRLKLAFHDTYTENARIKTKFEAVNDRDVIKKSLSRWKFIQNRGSLIIIRKRLQRT